MKKIGNFIYAITFLLILGCNPVKERELNSETKNELILIDLGNSIKFNWDLSKMLIVEDYQLDKLKEEYKNKRSFLIQKIKDTSLLDITICPFDYQLAKGDLAFLLIDKIEDLYYYRDLGIQMDTYTIGCSYPEGLIKMLNNQRSLIISKLTDLGSGTN